MPGTVVTSHAQTPTATSTAAVAGRALPTWLARALRGKAMLFAAYLAIALGVLGANPFRGESITPLDLLVRQHAFAWAELEPGPRFGERSDVLNGLLPPWIDVRRQLREGRVPTWNDDLAGGHTYLAPNYSMFTPAFAVFVAAPTPALGFHLAIALNLAIAGLGMHLFLRRHVGGVAAACGAVTFMFCGFHAAWLYWAHVHTSIWAPWLLLAIDRCVERPGMRRAIGIAVATTMVILGGFPFVAEMILCMGGLYFLVSWAYGFRDAGFRLRLPLWYAAGSALGLLACTPLLLELANWLGHYDLGYRQNRGSYLNLEHASRLLPPWSYEFKRVEQTMYVGLVMTAFAAATLLASLARPLRMSRIHVFGIALFAIIAALVFGVWPMWMIGWFPGMSFNAWSRSIGVMDLAIITLGVLAIDRAWKAAKGASGATGNGIWLKLLVVAVALFQVAEQGHFFRRYNGPVPASYFFPELPAVEYVRERVGPYDYVIGDGSFGIAGELGVYELRDWFAHQLKTNAHKQALVEMVPKHRRSHTASRFPASAIQAGSQTLSDFNVRYLIVQNHDPDTIGPARRKIGARDPMPQLPGAPWTQYFDVAGDGSLALRGISIRMATYTQRGVRGTVRLTLASPEGQTLATVGIDARTIIDNQLADFYFAEPLTLAPGRYRFTIDYAPADEHVRALTAWVLPPKGEAPLLVGTTPHAGELEYLLHVGESVRGNYRRVYSAAGLSVFESMRTPNGPYFLHQLDDDATPGSSSNVLVEHYQASASRLRYTGGDAGYVVVPQILTRDWKATVDGREVEPELKKGVMPALPVDGPATIELRYDPWNIGALLAWTGGMLALLGLMALLERYFRTKARNRVAIG